MDTPLPARQTRLVYRGRIFTVQVETVALPAGGTLEAEIVRHPGSVVIVPITDEGQVVLVRQYRPAIGRSVWELPAGSLRAGEDPEQAARRECHEETGLVPSQIDPLGSFFPTPGYCDEAMHFYRARGLRAPRAGEHADRDEDEDIEAHAFPVADITAMIGAGAIVDLKTVAGLALLSAR